MQNMNYFFMRKYFFSHYYSFSNYYYKRVVEKHSKIATFETMQ